MQQTKNKKEKRQTRFSLTPYPLPLTPCGGFTLVETLVAITVLVMAVAAPLTLGSQGLTASRVARDQVIATYLAQEGIEYLNNFRSTNVLSGKGWLTSLDVCLAGACRIDLSESITSQIIQDCGQTCPVLNYNSDLGLYGYGVGGTWAPTKFTRTITLQETVPGVEAKITVTMSWNDGIITRTVSTNEYILNWQ